MSPLKKIELQFHPTHHLEIVAASDGKFTYRSIGNDPNFDVRCSSGIKRLTPGWWRLRGRINVLDGAIITPRFYADYGNGYSESDCLALPEPAADGTFDAIFMLSAPLHRLRFDPTIRTAVFAIETLYLQKLPCVQALFGLVMGIGRSSHPNGLSKRIGAISDFIRLTTNSGVGRRIDMLQEQYIQARSYGPTSYEMWFRLFDPLHSEVVARAPNHTAHDELLITIVLPLQNPHLGNLTRCLNSVKAQTWPHWQLCVLGAPMDDASARLVEAAAAADARIQWCNATDNVEAASLRSVFPFLKGRYVGLLHQDDALVIGALGEMVHALRASPATRVMYSDEDRIDSTGRRFDPHFKPEWCEDLLRAQNYFGSFQLVHVDLLRKVIATPAATGDFQDHDLALRCSEGLQPYEIIHVPKILYHRGIEAGVGTNVGMDEFETSTRDCDAAAVQAQLLRRKLQATVEVMASGQLRTRWTLTLPHPRVTIIIPTRDRVELLRSCVESVFTRTEYDYFDVLIVDNGSVEADTLDYFTSLCDRDRISVIAFPGPFNFSSIVNHAVGHAISELICLLNNDMEVISPDWLYEMASHAMRSGVGAVGAMLYYPGGTIQHGGVIIGIGGVAGHVYHRSPRGSSGYHGRAMVVQRLSAVTGACLMVRKEIFEEVGGFDESLAIAFNDIDFCLRLVEKGYRNLWTPHAELYHHESASRGSEDTPDKIARFGREVSYMRNRWGPMLDNDPAYNPNLTLDGSHFELSFPPRLHSVATHFAVIPDGPTVHASLDSPPVPRRAQS